MTSLDDAIRFFETLTRQRVTELPRFYTEDARFKDPFNQVRGVAAIARIYDHMFDQVADPRFKITGSWQNDAGVMLTWDFSFGLRGAAGRCVVKGVSHLQLAADGRIDDHCDYWDPAEGVYEKIPVLGGLMRFIKARLRTP